MIRESRLATVNPGEVGRVCNPSLHGRVCSPSLHGRVCSPSLHGRVCNPSRLPQVCRPSAIRTNPVTGYKPVPQRIGSWNVRAGAVSRRGIGLRGDGSGSCRRQLWPKPATCAIPENARSLQSFFSASSLASNSSTGNPSAATLPWALLRMSQGNDLTPVAQVATEDFSDTRPSGNGIG